ncbi:MAG TPA: hypothetical protein H9736_03100 [Candidatus Anaerotruncus excrementipullorum]|uniref:GLUG domain-containing protein n=1 Tax=Candidatus Anaerotruncus excrementipullorum TaxID=2838465 RepID=A0A9D2B6L0_9FIRM|nr:hypothetical protein [Candidatus Anaerotruncus excrementipullorum]
MKRMLSLVLAAALLAGCAARGNSAAGEAGSGAASSGAGAAASDAAPEGAPAGEPQGEAASAADGGSEGQPLTGERLQAAQALLEQPVALYEALAGGRPVQSPQELPNDIAAAYCIAMAQAQAEPGTFRRTDDERVTQVPAHLVEAYSLEGVSIQGGSDVGGLVGSLSGGVYHCTVSGSVSGSSSVGGMVGFTDTAEMVDCHAVDIQVTGTDGTGGLAGAARQGWYEGCSASGTVDVVADASGRGLTARMAGGFAGHQQGSVIRYCFADVNVRTQATASMVGNFIGLSEYAATAHSYVCADAGGPWDPVDDFHGGPIQVEVLDRADYQATLEGTIPEGYTKHNGVFANEYNGKLDLVGAVDFTEGDLAALLYFPDEQTLANCQDYSAPEGSGDLLVLPIHPGSAVHIFLEGADGSREEFYSEDSWGLLGKAILLDCGQREGRLVIQVTYEGRAAECYADPGSSTEMHTEYLSLG